MSPVRVKVILLVLFLAGIANSLKQCAEPFTGLDMCTSDEKYNAGVPDYANGRPCKVGTSITLFGINEVDEARKTISINILVALWWRDTRLTLRSDNPNETLDWFNMHNIDGKNNKRVFFPSLKLANIKNVKRENKIDPGDNDFFWFRYPDYVEFQQSMLATTYCSFDFKSFPFDEHNCKVELGSAQFFVSNVIMEPSWIRYENKKSELGQEEIIVNQELVPFDIQLSSLKPYVRFEAGFNYSYTGMNVKLQRNTFGLLIGGVYGPTAIFAVLSLVSYTIKIEAVPGRLGLLVTLFLITANIYNSVEGPPDRGFSFLELWIVGIEIPFLVAIFEYGYLLLVNKFRKQEFVFHEETTNIEDLSVLMDKSALVLSATYIVIFVTLYWIILLNA